jgi:hypothetical protein
MPEAHFGIFTFTISFFASVTPEMALAYFSFLVLCYWVTALPLHI